jgi:hypothetical protein
MPASFTHQSFGNDVLERGGFMQLLAYKQIFNLGCQGPDLLFYFHPTKKNPINQKGGKMHQDKARGFFEESLVAVKKREDLSMLAYLCGFVCHYALDHACHPYINKIVDEKHFGHFAIERDLDLAMIQRVHPEHLSVAKDFTDEQSDIEKVGYLLGVEDVVIRKCIKSFKLLNGLIYNEHATIRYGLLALMKMAHVGSFSDMILKPADQKMKGDIEHLLNLYDKAVEEGIKAVQSIMNGYESEVSLSSFFDYNYE